MILDFLEVNDPKIIEEVDKAGVSNSVVEIDLNEAVSNTIQIGSYSYEQALRDLGGIEAKEEVKPRVEQAMPAARGIESEEVTKAAKEIKNVIGSLGKEFEKGIKKETQKIKGEKLILPTLSLQDQISELEKISEGIDEDVFTEEQMKIIKEEVNGLRDKIMLEKSTPIDEFQRSLIALRNQKVEEVFKKIS